MTTGSGSSWSAVPLPPPPLMNNNTSDERPPRAPEGTPTVLPPPSRTSGEMSSCQLMPNAGPLRSPQPIADAVNDAFDRSPAMNQLDPELIRQLTEQLAVQVTEQVREQVFRKLQATGPALAVQPPASPQATSRTPRLEAPCSPTQSSIASSIPRGHTPPTPEPMRDLRARVESCTSTPSDMAATATEATFGLPPEGDKNEFDRDKTTSRPSQTDNAGLDVKPPGRRRTDSDISGGHDDAQQTPRDNAGLDVRPPGRRRTDSDISGGHDDAQQTPRDNAGLDFKPPGRRRTDSDITGGHDDAQRSPRNNCRQESVSSFGGSSKDSMRVSRLSVGELTTLEKIWGPLFDNDTPTARLGQFLRGIAAHLIDDYEPRASLVVTPAKMARFFADTAAASEDYPWDVIFGGKLNNTSLSTMYRRLLCQHHLVQVQRHDVPRMPGLTPHGFESFMICLIQAHPDTEFDRLSKAVTTMPIANADSRTERFPKELSRRLLPADANLHAEQRLIASLAEELHQLPGLEANSSMPPPPPPLPPSPIFLLPERTRNPYSQSSFSSNAFDDDGDLAPLSIPLERERKPYVGREGCGRISAAAADNFAPVAAAAAAAPVKSEPGHRRISGAPTPAMYASGFFGGGDAANLPWKNSRRPSVPSNLPVNYPYDRAGSRRSTHPLHSSPPRYSSPPRRNSSFRNPDLPSLPKTNPQYHAPHMHPSRSHPHDRPLFDSADADRPRRLSSIKIRDRSTPGSGGGGDDRPRG